MLCSIRAIASPVVREGGHLGRKGQGLQSYERCKRDAKPKSHKRDCGSYFLISPLAQRIGTHRIQSHFLQSSSRYLCDLITVQLFLIHSIVYSSVQSQGHKPLFFSACCISHVEQAYSWLFVILVSLVYHHHTTIFHRHVLLLDRLLTFLVPVSSLVLKPFFSRSLSLNSHLPLAQAHL